MKYLVIVTAVALAACSKTEEPLPTGSDAFALVEEVDEDSGRANGPCSIRFTVDGETTTHVDVVDKESASYYDCRLLRNGSRIPVKIGDGAVEVFWQGV
jgi:hypothetical protein